MDPLLQEEAEKAAKQRETFVLLFRLLGYMAREWKYYGMAFTFLLCYSISKFEGLQTPNSVVRSRLRCLRALRFIRVCPWSVTVVTTVTGRPAKAYVSISPSADARPESIRTLLLGEQVMSNNIDCYLLIER